MANVEGTFARLPTSSFDIPCSVFDIPRSDEREAPGGKQAPGIADLPFRSTLYELPQTVALAIPTKLRISPSF